MLLMMICLMPVFFFSDMLAADDIILPLMPCYADFLPDATD